MNTKKNNRFTRRHFCRAVALPAGALLLGGGLPVWAAPNKKPQKKPAETAPAASAKTPCETKVLWDFAGCTPDRFMNRVSTYVYKENVYLWVLLPGLKTMIVKVPLAGGPAQIFPLMPGHVTGDDPHRFYTIAADALGYIHVVGDMHSSAHVKHWVSKQPEDISEFVFTSDDGENKRPQGYNVTYPALFRSPDGVLYLSIRCAEPVWGVAISVLDLKTQIWSMLGAEVPAAEISHAGRARSAKGKPLTAWEDNGEGGNFSYTQPHAIIRWDKNKRMHVAFSLLNENTPTSSTNRHTHTHLLYAYSDDGGKTFHRGDGSLIQMPMRAEPGPHQADVVYAEHEGPPPWLGVIAGINIDEHNRPVVSCKSFKTGAHRFVLENKKWTEQGKNANAGTAAASKAGDEDSEGAGESKPNLPYAPHKVNGEYLHATGNFLYTVFPEKDRFHGNTPKYHRILLALSKPVVTPGAAAKNP